MNKQLFIDLRDRLRTSNEIKHVALFNSQYTHEKEEKVFQFPATFVEFSRMDYRSESYGVEKVDIEITIHVCFRQLVEDLSFMDIIQNVSYLLHKWGGTYFSPLQRVSEEQDSDHDNVFVWKLVFKTTATDENSVNTKALTLINTPRTLEVLKDLDIDNNIIRTGDGQ